MDQLKTTKDHHYQQLARQDLLFPMFFTLDTTHLLMSALNEEASWKTVVFGWRKKKGKIEMDQIKQQGPQLSTIGKARLTAKNIGCCVWEEKEERVRCEMDQIKTQKVHHYH